MKNLFNFIVITLLMLLGGLSVNATTPSYGPNGENRNGIFYQYFTNMSTPAVSTNPFLVGFGANYLGIFGNGNTFTKDFLASYGSSSTDIVTGFNSDGSIKKSDIGYFMASYLGTNIGANPTGYAITGFNPAGSPIYSQNVGYWTTIAGGISYAGGVQIGDTIAPASLDVNGGNIVSLSTPSTDDDLITKGYADAYMKNMCTQFLGVWNDATGLCSKVGAPSSKYCNITPPCTDGVQCDQVQNPGSVNQTWTKGAASCGFSCINGYTGANCTTPPAKYCSATLPCDDGVQCDQVQNPGSVNQTWTKGAASCGFSCINGYTGANCETPPAKYCSATLPCDDGVQCDQVQNPGSVNQAWTKGAASCGFSCINGYTGANCETPTASTCSDSIQNGTETGIDCGGITCGACAVLGGNCSVLYYQKPVGATNDRDILPGTSYTFGANIGFVVIGSDLMQVGQKFTCPAVSSCSDGVKNGTETGVDCGGSCGVCAAITCNTGCGILSLGQSCIDVNEGVAFGRCATNVLPSDQGSIQVTCQPDGSLTQCANACSTNAQKDIWDAGGLMKHCKIPSAKSLVTTACGTNKITVDMIYLDYPTNLYNYWSDGSATLKTPDAVECAPPPKAEKTCSYWIDNLVVDTYFTKWDGTKIPTSFHYERTIHATGVKEISYEEFWRGDLSNIPKTMYNPNFKIGCDAQNGAVCQAGTIRRSGDPGGHNGSLIFSCGDVRSAPNYIFFTSGYGY